MQLSDEVYKWLYQVIKGEQQDDEDLFVRVSIGIGWGEPVISLSLEERPITGDTIYHMNEIKLLVHENDKKYLLGKKLDFIINPSGHRKIQIMEPWPIYLIIFVSFIF